MSVHLKEEPVLVPNCVEESELEQFGTCVDDISGRVNQLEQKVVKVEHFYSIKDEEAQANTSKSNWGGKKIAITHPNNSKCNSAGKGKSKAKHASSPDLMRQFAMVFRKITQDKLAWPFLEPVDVKGLRLHDYYTIIEKPMDLGTIKKKMEDLEYNNVHEIYADVRLVFENAMTYNEEEDDVYKMAKSLLGKFENKWVDIKLKLVEEKQADEEAEKHANQQLTLEAAHAQMARDLSNELYEIDLQLERLRESVVQRCRKLSSKEKKILSAALTRLSHEDLSKALKMVSESNPSFPAEAEEVEFDIDVQSDVTLWRLKVFVQEALKAGNKSSGGTNAQNNNNTGEINKNTAKRRREISDAMNKASIKRAKKA